MEASELLAERSYELFRAGRLGERTPIKHWRCLFRRPDNIGAYYLAHLLLQGPGAERVLNVIVPELMRMTNPPAESPARSPSRGGAS